MSVEDTTANEAVSEETVTEETSSEETTETTDETKTENPEGEGESEATESTDSDESKQTSASEDSDKGSDEEPEFYFNGQKVEVEVPEDLRGTLEESGVDVNTVLKELYGKDSDFTLSEDTRKPLDEKYGKPVVDTFLSALKDKNESFLSKAEQAEQAKTKAEAEAKEWSDELVGGEENWTAMESWAADNLDEAQIDSFNKAMQSGDKWIQELAIKDMNSKMREAEGDTSASLISGDAPATDTSGAPMTADEYIKEMTSPEFRSLKGEDKIKAQKQIDARRRAGIKRGM